MRGDPHAATRAPGAVVGARVRVCEKTTLENRGSAGGHGTHILPPRVQLGHPGKERQRLVGAGLLGGRKARLNLLRPLLHLTGFHGVVRHLRPQRAQQTGHVSRGGGGGGRHTAESARVQRGCAGRRGPHTAGFHPRATGAYHRRRRKETVWWVEGWG
jgi:hypothetical protein